MALVPNVTGDDVGEVVGRTDSAFVNGAAQTAASIARETASSYTRGVGFEDPAQIPAALRPVILMRAIRLLGNMQQLVTEQRDGARLDYGPGGTGFTFQEILALDEYRATAASC